MDLYGLDTEDVRLILTLVDRQKTAVELDIETSLDRAVAEGHEPHKGVAAARVRLHNRLTALKIRLESEILHIGVGR